MSQLTEELSVSKWLDRGRAYLSQRGVTEIEANLEFLMADALGVGRGEIPLAGEKTLSARQGSHFWERVKERGRRMPLAYVLGTQPFMGFEMRVTRSVLIPRPETEQLVEWVIETAKNLPGPLHIIDIGTGTGCVPVALAKNLPDCVIYATEISDPAMKVAEDNARRHGVSHRIRFLAEDLFKPRAAASPWADIVVSNPPYIPTGDLEGLSQEVRREPYLALDGGKDGLAAVRAIVSDAPRLLKPGGALLLEFGDGQSSKVAAIFERAGFAGVEIRKDLQGHDRFARALRPK